MCLGSSNSGLGEAQRAAYESFDPGPEMDVFALDLLRVLLAHLMLLGIEMPLISPPTIGVKLRDAKRCQQLLEVQEDGFCRKIRFLGKIQKSGIRNSGIRLRRDS